MRVHDTTHDGVQQQKQQTPRLRLRQAACCQHSLYLNIFFFICQHTLFSFVSRYRNHGTASRIFRGRKRFRRGTGVAWHGMALFRRGPGFGL